MTKIPSSNFVFKKHMSIGEADAEHDRKFLEECFVDIGDYSVLADTTETPSILVGRTGAGKSALLEQIEKNSERVIKIEPEELALKHVSNSTVLQFFEGAGVNLDIFYNLLWQHTFTVELIKHKYNINSHTAKTNFLSDMFERLSGNTKKIQALKYIEEWGDKFWVDTETRIREFTEKLESSLTDKLSTIIPGFLKYNGETSEKLTEEQKFDVVHYGKKVVSSVQIEKLSKIISLLAEDIFTDPQKKTYIVIDRLDENWIDDELRNKLIKALIETIKKFRNINNIKIIITLRIDLLNRVLEKTRDPGYQREKYESLFLHINWNRKQLHDLLDKRINHLLKHKYTNSEVFFDDIFPNKLDKLPSIDYLLDRTLLRPRDAIMFVNFCLKEAQDKTEIDSGVIKVAEKSYSIDRLESIKDEWHVEHPLLNRYISLLHHKATSFKLASLKQEDIQMLALELSESKCTFCDSAIQSAIEYSKSNYPQSENFLNQFIKNVFYILYKVGAIGIKVDGTSSVKWIHDRTQDLIVENIETNSIVYIHKILWRALAIDKSQ
jgi:hypothetical protein